MFSKAQYWGAYQAYLTRFVAQTRGVADLLDAETR